MHDVEDILLATVVDLEAQQRGKGLVGIDHAAAHFGHHHAHGGVFDYACQHRPDPCEAGHERRCCGRHVNGHPATLRHTP
jgi:hypothetical protein